MYRYSHVDIDTSMCIYIHTYTYVYMYMFAARVNTKLVSRSGRFSHAEQPAVQAVAVKQASRPTTATDRKRGKQD